jgi:signal transduction histidine kinase
MTPLDPLLPGSKKNGFRAAVRQASTQSWVNTQAIRRRVLPKKRFWRVHHSLKLPNLQLYQQIIICFIAVVLIPLLGVSFIIYNINQSALKKELRRYTEHTAEALYRDLATEIQWQQRQSQLLAHYLQQQLQQGQSPAQAIAQTNQLSLSTGNTTASHITLGLLAPGKPMSTASTMHLQLKPSSALQAGQYHLQMEIPVTVVRHGKPQGLVVRLDHPFNYLSQLLKETERTLRNGVSIIDDHGVIIAAGDEAKVTAKHVISANQLQQFKHLTPGLTHRSFVVKRKQSINNTPDDDEPLIPQEQVMIKIPHLGWGLMIESPYNVQQQFVKRAKTQSLLLIVACLLLVMVLAAGYVYTINRNFRQLIKATKALAQGNYTRRLRLITNSFTPYEIIYLAGEFNRMGRKMSESWASIQTLNHELTQANQQLAKLDDMKSNLIDTVSHELRTPLTSIKGYSARLLRYEGTPNSPIDPAMRKKSLKIIKQQADRLERMVDDLLVIPELDQARLRVFMDNVALWPIIERCVLTVESRLEENSASSATTPAHHIVVSSMPDTLLQTLQLQADPDRLEQVLINLLDNAVKYSVGDAPITLTVALEANNNRVLISISNPCPPIDEQTLAHLFDKFKRLDESLQRTTRGSGLGLYITRGLVQAMGGTIQLTCLPEGLYTATVALDHSSELGTKAVTVRH